MAEIQIGNSHIQGIYGQLDGTWEQMWPTFQAQYEPFFHHIGNESAGRNLARNASFAWKESVPFPQRWDRGTSRNHQVFKDIKIDVPIYRFELTMDVEIHDQEDDQLGVESAKRHMQLAVNRYLVLPMKLLAEYLNGTSVDLPSLDVAYDGVNLFSTVDGDGNARFGVTSGNLLTGDDGGTVTVQGMTNDIFNAHQQFIQYLDPAGEIIYDESMADIGNFLVIVPPEMAQVANEVAKSEYLRFTGSTDGGIQTNVLKNRVNYMTNPYLTSADDYFILLRNNYWKPMLKRQNTDVRSIWSDLNNSDRAREEYIESLYTDTRIGLSVWCPFTCIKVNN